MSYENDDAGSAMPALMHNMGQLEYQQEWARCWIDLGTSDGIALDVLINACGSWIQTWFNWKNFDRWCERRLACGRTP